MILCQILNNLYGKLILSENIVAYDNVAAYSIPFPNATPSQFIPGFLVSFPYVNLKYDSLEPGC